MLLDIGVLLGIYIGVRLFENKKLTKHGEISPVKSVGKKIIQTQSLSEEITSDYPEKNMIIT